jgi:predicted metal-dependent enzyme (double-stranded beta helix superfamily)
VAPIDESVRAACALAADPDRWRPLVRHVPGDRWYLPLLEQDDLCAWLITWAPGTLLPFHDHGTATGALAIVAGELVEEVSTRSRVEAGLPPSHLNRLPAGTIEPLVADLVHEVRNEGLVPAVSIHVYAPRLDGMTFYEGLAR